MECPCFGEAVRKCVGKEKEKLEQPRQRNGKLPADVLQHDELLLPGNAPAAAPSLQT